MTWVLVMTFLAGPLQGQLFEYRPDGHIYHFPKQAECEERADALKSELKLEFKSSPNEDLHHPFIMRCVGVRTIES